MIFKGNTKMTPALTELLDDTTPSSSKTYSSNKIETLIGGGGGGGLELYATIDATTLTNLMTKTVYYRNTVDIVSTVFQFNKNNINIVKPITDLENYYFLFVFDYYHKYNVNFTATSYDNLKGSVTVRRIADNFSVDFVNSAYSMTIPNNIMCEIFTDNNFILEITCNIKKMGDNTITVATESINFNSGGGGAKIYAIKK